MGGEDRFVVADDAGAGRLNAGFIFARVSWLVLSLGHFSFYTRLSTNAADDRKYYRSPLQILSNLLSFGINYRTSQKNTLLILRGLFECLRWPS